MLSGTGSSAKGTHGRSRMGWVMWHRGQHLALGWARRCPGGSSGAGAVRAHPGWELQDSHACVSGGTGANPCGMPWPGERGRPRRLGAGSVGFQGSCRAGAATGTDGSRAGPAPPWGSWLGLEVLASPLLATGAVVSPASGAGQILPRALCLAMWGGRRHPLSPASAPQMSRALLRYFHLLRGSAWP